MLVHPKAIWPTTLFWLVALTIVPFNDMTIGAVERTQQNRYHQDNGYTAQRDSNHNQQQRMIDGGHRGYGNNGGDDGGYGLPAGYSNQQQAYPQQQQQQQQQHTTPAHGQTYSTNVNPFLPLYSNPTPPYVASPSGYTNAANNQGNSKTGYQQRYPQQQTQRQQPQQQQTSQIRQPSYPTASGAGGYSVPTAPAPVATYPVTAPAAYVPIQPAYTVTYYPAASYKPTPAPPGPFVPAPPGQRPYCAKDGETFCENVDYYPTQLVLRLLENTDASSLLTNEEEVELPKYSYYNYTPTYYYDYSYSTHHNPYVNSHGYRGKRQAGSGTGEGLCPVREEFVAAKAALNNKGDWKYVINVPEVDSKYTQLVKVSKCRTTTCSGLCTPPTGAVARCEQQFVQKRLVALDPSGSKLYNDVFLFPDCCLCKIQA